MPPGVPPRHHSPLKAHLGRQESIHLVVEGVEEETQRLPADTESGAQPRRGGHPAQGPRSPLYLLMVCLMGLSCRWM